MITFQCSNKSFDFAFQHEFYAVVHLAALKAVGESVEIPLQYYHNNVTGSINLLQVRKVPTYYKIIMILFRPVISFNSKAISFSFS